jgi:hypothetical protein
MRSLLAVLTGLVVLTVTSFGIEGVTNPLLQRLFPRSLSSETALNYNAGVKVFMLVYTAACVALGGYVTAWIAGEARASLAMGIVQALLTAAAMAQFGERAPLWFWIVAIALIPGAAWLGGVLRVRSAVQGPSRV